MKRIITSLILISLLIGCSEKRPEEGELLNVYKIAFKSIYEMERESYNKDVKYIVMKLDNLNLLPENKELLVRYMFDLSSIEVSEGDYSKIEEDLINQRRYGGMSIALDNPNYLSDNKIEIKSRKFYLVGLEMLQTLEKQDGQWTLTKKSQIKRSK